MNAQATPLAALPALLPDIAAAAVRHDRDGSFPHDSLALLRNAGLPGLTVPAALGGGGAGLRLAAEAVAQIGAACPATALVLAMQYIKHAALARSPDWPAALRQRVQRDAVTGGALINALRVEPELGSPTRGGLPATVARRTAEGWLVSGHKRYSTGIPGLRWLEVHGRTDEAEPRIGTFLVPAEAPGIEIVETWDHLGLRASGSHDVLFRDVPIPADHAIGLATPGAGAGPDATQMAWNTVLVTRGLYRHRPRRARLDHRLPARPRAEQPRRAAGHAGARPGIDRPGRGADRRQCAHRRGAGLGDRCRPAAFHRQIRRAEGGVGGQCRARGGALHAAGRQSRA